MRLTKAQPTTAQPAKARPTTARHHVTRPLRLASILVACLLAAACGARLDPAVRARAADATLNVGGGGTGGGSNTTGGGPTTTTTGGITATTGGGKTTTGRPGSSSNGGFTTTGKSTAPGGPAQPALPPGGNGGATDVGVTATQITLGNVADLSGPQPGLFQGAPYGLDAFAAYLNSQGGIFGRTLRVASGDSGTDCTTNQNAHTDLRDKVFTFVGSFSLYDQCGTPVIQSIPTLTEIAYPLSVEAKNDPQNFPPQAVPEGYQTGMFCYWAKQFGSKVQHIGSIYPSVPSAAHLHAIFKKVAAQCGWNWVDDEQTSATQTTFQTEIAKMQNQGVQIVFIDAENSANDAEIKAEIDAAGWKPLFISPVAYASDFVSRVGGPAHAEGVIGSALYSLFFSQADSARIPEVQLFQTWMHNVHPGAPIDLYAMYAWASGRLFQQAATAAGPKLTRAGLQAELKKIHSFDDSNFVQPTDPGAHKPSNCYVLFTIHNGEFLRVDSPSEGFRCDGTYFLTSG